MQCNLQQNPSHDHDTFGCHFYTSSKWEMVIDKYGVYFEFSCHWATLQTCQLCQARLNLQRNLFLEKIDSTRLYSYEFSEYCMAEYKYKYEYRMSKYKYEYKYLKNGTWVRVQVRVRTRVLHHWSQLLA